MYSIYHQAMYTPHDLMGEAVYEKTKGLLRQHGLCCCDACCSAVTSCALCDLPAMKSSCANEDIHMRSALLDQQLKANMFIAILNAMKQTGVFSGVCRALGQSKSV